MMTMSTIRTAVQDEFKINIKRKTRKHIYVVARTIYFKLCRDYTNYSLQRIGLTLGKDHATVMHAIDNIFESWNFCQKYSKRDKKYINIYDKIRLRIGTDLNSIKKKTAIPVDYKAQAEFWKRRYLRKHNKRRYRQALINYKNTHLN
tara:strand:- start:1559 stop:1999 length:441 start_codon:yes stop_codon:yes gene_type:complete